MRLLVALISLLALVCVVVGIATELALRSFLIGRVDDQLQAAAARSATAGQHPDGDDGSHDGQGPMDRGAGFVLAPGQAAGTLGARIVGGRITEAAQSSQAGGLNRIDPAAVASLTGLPVDGRPHTRNLGGLGAFRCRSPAHRTATCSSRASR